MANDRLSAKISVGNTGVGHYFPTYVTPKVVVHGFQEDAGGRRLEGTEQLFIIGRQVSLDITKEIADTRIAPDGEASFDYRMPRHRSATALMWQVEIQPDAFYLEFYRELLKYPTKGEEKRLITEARDQASASPYIVFSKRLALPRERLLWKRGTTIYRDCVALGAARCLAQKVAANSKRYWFIGSRSLNGVLTMAYFDRMGFHRLSNLNFLNRPVRTRMPGGVAGGGSY